MQFDPMREKMSLFSNLTPGLKRKFIYAQISIPVTLPVGTSGFHFIAGLSWPDSIYPATATVTTVNDGDILPATRQGRLGSATDQNKTLRL